jgi:hypothetical protein
MPQGHKLLNSCPASNVPVQQTDRRNRFNSSALWLADAQSVHSRLPVRPCARGQECSRKGRTYGRSGRLEARGSAPSVVPTSPLEKTGPSIDRSMPCWRHVGGRSRVTAPPLASNHVQPFAVRHRAKRLKLRYRKLSLCKRKIIAMGASILLPFRARSCNSTA